MPLSRYLFDMEILPLTTGLLRPKDDLADRLGSCRVIRDGDILIVSSKAVAMTEGSLIRLADCAPSEEANLLSSSCGRSAPFCEAVLRETRRLGGRVAGTCQGAVLTELRPEGMAEGVLLVPNAGLDESNVSEGFAIGWPHVPVDSLRAVKEGLGADIALILTDSCCVPRRSGVTAFALACVGIDPFRSEIGNTDLFGKTMRVTVEATADQLAIAGNAVMGNAAQATPAAVIREHGIPFSTFSGWVNGMDPKKDLFKDMYR